ncbi:MAG: hypothetical protein Q9190_003433 [Brigantiaea leucoxantha]
MRGYAALKSTKSLEEENLNLTSEPEDAQEKTRCLLKPLGDVKDVPPYDRTFTDFGPESDAAWTSMFPRGYYESDSDHADTIL